VRNTMDVLATTHSMCVLSLTPAANHGVSSGTETHVNGIEHIQSGLQSRGRSVVPHPLSAFPAEAQSVHTPAHAEQGFLCPSSWHLFENCCGNRIRKTACTLGNLITSLLPSVTYAELHIVEQTIFGPLLYFHRHRACPSLLAGSCNSQVLLNQARGSSARTTLLPGIAGLAVVSVHGKC